MRMWLKELRENENMTQLDLSKRLGISESYYNMIENGERQRRLRIETARKLADVFGISYEYIFEHEA